MQEHFLFGSLPLTTAVTQSSPKRCVPDFDFDCLVLSSPLTCLAFPSPFLAPREQLVDRRISRCQRRENAFLGTVDFVEAPRAPAKEMKKKRSRDANKVRVAFRTCPRERERVVFQLGTSRPQMALEAAKLVQHDVAGIDLNMGCPKRFSVQDGMGVALLREGGKVACEVLRTLRSGSSFAHLQPSMHLPSVGRWLGNELTLARSIGQVFARASFFHARSGCSKQKQKP